MSIVNRNNARHYKWGNDCDGWLLCHNEKLSVIEEVVPPGSYEERHYHQNSEQFFYVLSGVATIELDGIVHLVSANNGLHIPSKSPHKLSNEGHENLCFIVVSTPPSHEDKVKA